MTSEICAKCGMLKTSHPTRYCEKFKPQNHNPPENTSDLVEASKCSEDTGPDASKSSGSGSLSDENVKEKVRKMFFPDGSLSDKIFSAFPSDVLNVEDVKEAVKKLKKGFREFGNKENIYKFIDKIFREALTNG